MNTHLLIAAPLLLCGLFFVLTPIVRAETPAPINIWPGFAPGETTKETGTTYQEAGGPPLMTSVTQPQLFFYPAPGRGRHPAVIVCPGGGYSILAFEHEGVAPAQWLNSIGVDAFVLHYRVPNNREGAFQDIERAVSLVRSRAKKYGIDSDHIGVLGFSAGGHLCARLASGFEESSYAPVDKADKTSCRPDFVLLIYPAYLADRASGLCPPEVAPHSGMPPVFVTQTRDDQYFDADIYAAALSSANIPVTAQIYASGGHGYGLELPADNPAHEWPDRAAEWIKTQVGAK